MAWTHERVYVECIDVPDQIWFNRRCRAELSQISKMGKRKVKNSIKIFAINERTNERNARAIGIVLRHKGDTAKQIRERALDIGAAVDVDVVDVAVAALYILWHSHESTIDIRRRISYPTAIITFHNSFA